MESFCQYLTAVCMFSICHDFKVKPFERDVLEVSGSSFGRVATLRLNSLPITKWFEPRSISSSYCVIVRVRVVLKRTVVGDQRFDNLSTSLPLSQVKCFFYKSDPLKVEPDSEQTRTRDGTDLIKHHRLRNSTNSSFRNYAYPDDHTVWIGHPIKITFWSTTELLYRAVDSVTCKCKSLPLFILSVQSS